MTNRGMGWNLGGLFVLFFCSALLASESLVESYPRAESASHVEVGMRVPVVNAEVGLGFHAGLTQEISVGYPLFIGLDLGVVHWGTSARNRDPLGLLPRVRNGAVATAVELLPTFTYHFLLPMLPGAIPYLGISAGPTLYFAADDETRESTILAQLVIRPGVHVIATETMGLDFETRVGVLGTHLFFVPQLSVLWTL